MDNTSLNCPLCCNESFDSLETLKIHISDVLNKLECPICKGNFSAFENFTQHLEECETTENFQSNEFRKLENLEDQNNVNEDGKTQGGVEYYCEICDVNFVEMKKHLMEHHMGQQVAVDSQDLDDIMTESEAISGDESKPIIETKPSDTEHIFLEQEILDKDGKFYTKKLTKINIIQQYPDPPIVEKLVFDKGPELTLRVYRCPRCNIRFSQSSSYHKHDCGFGKGEVCDTCSIYFSSKSGLSQHRKKCHGESESEGLIYNCEVCNIHFPTEKSLVLHSKIHAPRTNQRIIDSPVTYNINGTKVEEETNETFTCEVCGKAYNKKYEEVHMKSHGEELPNCSICNRKFSGMEDLSLHLQAHGNEVEKKISCRFCKKLFTAGESLDEHHCEGRKYGCSFCGKKFSKPHEKVKHERIHTGLKPYVCEICGKSFRVSYCLTLHMRTHSGVRPYQCKICEKRFKSHSVYSHHVQIHSDVRSYQCPFCPKAFKTAVQLAGHKNSHTKPFSCNICNRPFASLYAVRLHTKSHDRKNELKHQCHICGAEYLRYPALRDHVGTHSDEGKEDSKKMPENKEDERGVDSTHSDVSSLEI